MCLLVSQFIFRQHCQPAGIRKGSHQTEGGGGYFLNNFHMRYFTIGLLCVMSHCWVGWKVLIPHLPVSPSHSDNRGSYFISDFLFSECHKENKYHHCLVKMVSTLPSTISWKFQKLSPNSISVRLSGGSRSRFKIL